MMGGCNPNQNWLYDDFYKPYVNGILELKKKFVQSLMCDNPDPDEDYLKDMNEMEEGPEKERLVHGNWDYATDDNLLMTYQKYLMF